jgi:hypothetical protein
MEEEGRGENLLPCIAAEPMAETGGLGCGGSGDRGGSDGACCAVLIL